MTKRVAQSRVCHNCGKSPAFWKKSNRQVNSIFVKGSPVSAIPLCGGCGKGLSDIVAVKTPLHPNLESHFRVE